MNRNKKPLNKENMSPPPPAAAAAAAAAEGTEQFCYRTFQLMKLRSKILLANLV
jgi:hypothetical protein